MSCNSFKTYIYQNFTKLITKFLNNFQKVLMFKLIILDSAIKLREKCSGFI